MDGLQILNANKIRPSGLRIKILEYILSHKTHPTIDEIYAELLKDNPTLSKTTVYNTTRILAENHLIKTITIDGQQVRYDGNVAFHGHFRCKNCGRIYDFNVNHVPEEAELKDFLIENMDVYYVGSCKNCNENL